METIKTYEKKSGELMFYINDTNSRVSLGYGEKILSTKLTKGQKNLLDKFFEAFKACPAVIENFKEIEAHNEKQADLHLGLKLYCTDTAKVAGHDVGMDGFYIGFENKLVSFNELNEALNA